MSTGTQSGLTITSTITSAEFRALFATFSALLTTGGITKTADSGQIDWTTVNWPGSNISAGYEIRQFTDAAQGTTPIVFKIDWKRVGTALCELVFTFGTGADGSGNITGVKYTGPSSLYVFAQAVAGTGKLYYSAGTNRFFLYWETGTGNQASLFSLERPVDANGDVTTEGLLFYGGHPAGSPTSIYVPYSGAIPAADTTAQNAAGCMMPTGQTTGLHSSGDVAVYPWFYSGIGELKVGRNLVGVFQSNFTNYNTYTVSLLGQTQVMFKPPPSFLPVVARGGTPTAANAVPLMRYE